MASQQFTPDSERSKADGVERVVGAVDYRVSAGKREAKPTGVEVVHESHPLETGVAATGIMANATMTAAHAAESAKNTANSAASAIARAAQSAKDAISDYSSHGGDK